MQVLKSVVRSAGVTAAVALTLGTAGNVAAQSGAALSVQNGDSAAGPQVRSVQRDATDNERVTAASNETVELLFADGSSITLAPGTSIVVDRYRYDPAQGSGELRLRVQSGSVRITGGVLNNSNAISLSLPGGTALLDNAVAYVEVAERRAEIVFVAGRAITVKGASETRSLSAGGAALALNGAGIFASDSRKLRGAELERYANLVNPGLSSGIVPTFVVDARTPTNTQEIAATAFGSGEDETAKDVKLAPDLPSPIGPARPCVSGSCLAGAPSFDLGASLGTIGNRQTGRSNGAVWQRQYEQGAAVATQGPINAPAPDYSSAGDGYRNTTARVFTASALTPYSLTLGAATPAASVSNYGELNCLAASSSGCRSNPIVNLYAGANGAVYRVGGLQAGDPPDLSSEIHIAFPGDMSSGAFGAYRLLVAMPFDLTTQGTVSSASVRAPITGCVRGTSTDCDEAYGSADARQNAVNNPTFLNPYAPSADSVYYTFAPLSLFSSYAPVLTYSETQPLPDNPLVINYNVAVSFEGNSAYDAFGLLTGFNRVPVLNSESAVNEICDLGTNACQTLAVALFGADALGGPRINRDLSNPGGLPDYDPESRNVLVRAADSFLAAEAISRLPGDNQRLFYATGSVSGRLPNGAAAQAATLDRFRLGAGLDPAATLGRAFLRPDTLLNIAPSSLLSSDLLVLNAPYTTSLSTASRAFHYDFAATGPGATQTSTISVTLGTLAYDPAATAAQLSGRTVGSTSRAGATRYSGSVQSPVFSTAVGGGNPNLPDTGRAGYLVLENYDPLNAPNGGLERTVENGAASQTNYANLRVGQVVQGGAQAAPANRIDLNLSGYAAGFAEITSTAANSPVAVQSLSADFQLVTNAAQGSVGATLAAAIGSATATLNFGSRASNASGLSAYTGAKEFAAMTAATPNLAAGAIAEANAANAAIVSGAPLIGTSAQGWTAGLDDATRTRMATNAAGTSGYRYLQWGFFFGDFATSDGRQAHAHLTSWIAGRPTPEGTPLPTGVVDYSGHVFANISNGSQLYSAGGSYANRWDFAARAGTGSMSLDGHNYSLATRLLGLQRNGTQVTSDSTARFEGLISVPTEGAYVGSLNGSFVAAPAATTDPLQLRSGVMGHFSLTRSIDGNEYRAVGTFGAERTTP